MAVTSVSSSSLARSPRVPLAIPLVRKTRDDARIVAFALMSALAVAVILWLGRERTFLLDEFDFLGRKLTIADVLAPHNEHLSALPVIAYRILISTFGTDSYLPYLALLLLLHVAVAGAVMAIVGGRLGLLAAAVVLFLGSGYENLFWAFQIGFVGSVAAGLWAMRVRRPWLAAALVGMSLACSGIGLVFIAPVAWVHRRGSIWLLVPVAGYVAWMLAFGRDPQQSGSLAAAVEWFALGIGWAFASVFQVGLALGLGIAAAVAVLARRADRLAIAALIALVVEYALIAVARSGMEMTSFVGASRYVYVAAPFILIALAGSVRDRRIVSVIFVFALVANIVALPSGAAAL